MSAERLSNVTVKCDALGRDVSVQVAGVEVEGVTSVTWDYPAGSLPTVTLVLHDVDVVAEGRAS